MRIAIFSDVHGNLAALEAVLDDIDEQGELDQILFAGDLCVFGAHPAECLQLLRQREIAGVHGNTDLFVDGPPLLSDDIVAEERERARQIDDVVAWTRAQLSAGERAWLSALPFHRRISPTGNPGDDLLVVHANPLDVNQVIYPPVAQQEALLGEVKQTDADLHHLLSSLPGGVLAFGHIHVPFVRPWGELTLANISSVSLPMDGDGRAKYGLLEWDGRRWQITHRRVAYEIEPERDAYELRQPPGWETAVERLADWGRAP